MFAARLFLMATMALSAFSPAEAGNLRTYYIAAEEVDWDYAPLGAKI